MIPEITDASSTPRKDNQDPMAETPGAYGSGMPPEESGFLDTPDDWYPDFDWPEGPPGENDSDRLPDPGGDEDERW